MPVNPESSISFRDKLSRLTQFNQALVYGFDPEAPIVATFRPPTFTEHLYFGDGQHRDMLGGYLYAQNELLPALKARQLDTEDFVQGIKHLNGFFANTLLSNNSEKPGHYSEQQIFRWHADGRTEMYLHLILNEVSLPQFTDDPKTMLINLLVEELNLSIEEGWQFINLMRRLQNDDSIIPRDSQKKYLGDISSIIVLEKLAVVFLNNKLSNEEKNLVNKIVKICSDPAEFEQAMDDFAKNTLADWQVCDKKDPVVISNFLANIFYQLTEIHPFANGNGRTATCLINVFLRAVELPSILLRNPGEKKIKSSSYTNAIQCINQTREPLANHILQRISTSVDKPFANEKLADIVILRCDMVEQLQLLQQQFPHIDINRYALELDKCARHPKALQCSNQEDNAICVLTLFLEFIIQEKKNLESPSKNNNKAPIFLVTTQLTFGERNQLKQDLTTLTQNNGWKINPKDHLAGWIEISDINEAGRVKDLINQLGIANAVLKQRIDTKTPVVHYSNLKLAVVNNHIATMIDQVKNNSTPRASQL